MSYSENLVERSLRLVLPENIQFMRNYRPDFLKNPETGRNLEMDFYIPTYKVAFEIQGEHHYMNEEQINRDKIKKQLLYENGIRLIELSITQISPSVIHRVIRNIGVPYNAFNKEWLKLTEYKNYKHAINSTYKGDKCLVAPSTNQERKEKLELDTRLENSFLIECKYGRGKVIGLTAAKVIIKLQGSNKIRYIKRKEVRIIY